MQAKIASLEAAFAEAVAKKEALAQQVADCTAKLQRADKLIGGLGGERVCCPPSPVLVAASVRLKGQFYLILFDLSLKVSSELASAAVVACNLCRYLMRT